MEDVQKMIVEQYRGPRTRFAIIKIEMQVKEVHKTEQRIVEIFNETNEFNRLMEQIEEVQQQVDWLAKIKRISCGYLINCKFLNLSSKNLNTS